MTCDSPSLAPIVVTTSVSGSSSTLKRRLGQLLHRDVRARNVGIAEAEVDDVLTGPSRFVSQLVDDREDVGRQPVDAAELHDELPR